MLRRMRGEIRGEEGGERRSLRGDQSRLGSRESRIMRPDRLIYPK
jgi:hypothetical protein